MDERITRLETLVAEQEQTIVELSDVIARQWQEIDAIRLKLETLSKRFVALEEQTAPDTPVTKPPHW